MNRFIVPAGWTLLIFFLSSIPGDELDLPDFWDTLSMDKAAHLLFYAVLAWFWLMSVSVQSGKGIRGMIIILCILYGGCLEWYQSEFVPGRTLDAYDFLADTAGVLFGTYFYQNKHRKTTA